MAAWIAAISLVTSGSIAGVRSLRDRFAIGGVLGFMIAALALMERLTTASFLWTIGGAATLAVVAVVVTAKRERRIPAARAQSRDLLYPFIACAGVAVGEVGIVLLARSLSEP